MYKYMLQPCIEAFQLNGFLGTNWQLLVTVWVGIVFLNQVLQRHVFSAYAYKHRML